MIDASDITGMVLSGGRGTRMGGVDKGLLLFNGVPLAQHTLQRLQSSGGVGHMLINANRHLNTYAAFGVPVVSDELADFAGPLAGFLVGLVHCNTPYLLTLPCDTPLFPLDLSSRLAAALETHQADIAMASAPEADDNGQQSLRPQPVFCLLRAELRNSLTHFTQTGGRKVGAWTAQHHTVLVPFDQAGDDPLAFFNANTPTELQQVERHSP
ncbi:molybdenum cofactor guanylyltransferase MobA [Rhodoferax sp. U11-2br]|uniref:molybdenum cofactor guanylyltransferase MobA n=1 Tax=Rhodoferax sp. U11-2br TaxID=2838878 RepID=UPI001BEAA2FF|nr:molybdenum cofactor guanylyltransferase MobA [Rhodoferax sp. U11-2br]MBT3068311.1 molybdenum cofactor guanylyltransferase MobA [Rhodoferax sp. U11-2br]